MNRRETKNHAHRPLPYPIPRLGNNGNDVDQSLDP